MWRTVIPLAFHEACFYHIGMRCHFLCSLSWVFCIVGRILASILFSFVLCWDFIQKTTWRNSFSIATLLHTQCFSFSRQEQEYTDSLPFRPLNMPRRADHARSKEPQDWRQQPSAIVLALCWWTLQRRFVVETADVWTRMAYQWKSSGFVVRTRLHPSRSLSGWWPR